jgi:tRNA 2-selenouridine synthase
MSVRQIELEEFLNLAEKCPVLDVRSPAEFKHAHISGAYSLPLFTDDERKIVGTTYKQQNREDAIKTGLDYFGPKMKLMIEEVERLLASGNGADAILVHCWRGGMRSAGVAWLLDLYGFKVYTLSGGYKSYRRYALELFSRQWPMRILGGYTGSGKTDILQKLKRLGETVIDLEALAMHKGSAFGHLGQPEQPSQEMFENMLALELHRMSTQSGKPIEPKTFWLEDESLRIGSLFIPQPFYKQMRTADSYFLEIPFHERLKYIVKGYGQADRDKLINGIVRIQKRLGGLETKTAVNCLLENDVEGAFRVLLKYYDKWYEKGLSSREPGAPLPVNIPAASVDPVRNSQLLLNNLN